MEEKSAQHETMRRENRRVAAMSWGPSDDMPPPPKPSRYPLQGECNGSFKLKKPLIVFNFFFYFSRGISFNNLFLFYL